MFYLMKLKRRPGEMNKNFFICGNGGSGANAIHIANDFIYGAGITNKKGSSRGFNL